MNTQLLNKDLKDMWDWYALPAIIITTIGFALFMICMPAKNHMISQNDIINDGVSKVEIVGRWE